MISRLIRKLQHRLSCIAGWTKNMEEKKYKAIIEGILFSMGESVELEKIAGALGLDQKKTKELIDEMRNEWEEQKRGVTITELDGAYQMCTRPEIYEYLIKIAKQPKRRVLTDVLLETLSIIAYKQPVTKMEIEKIRGVSSDHAVNKLVEYHLVCELGRLDAPGRPLLFGTTEEFLQGFREGDRTQYFYDRGLIYYALSNPDMGSCYEISSFLLSKCTENKENCILEKKTRDFDGPYHTLFQRKNYDVLQTAELCDRLFEAGADPNQAGEKNILPIELMMALPFTEEELHPLYDFWMKLPAVDLKLHTFDGKQPIDFAKKYKRKKLATWIKNQL